MRGFLQTLRILDESIEPGKRHQKTTTSETQARRTIPFVKDFRESLN
jgi:hypothetical protein